MKSTDHSLLLTSLPRLTYGVSSDSGIVLSENKIILLSLYVPVIGVDHHNSGVAQGGFLMVFPILFPYSSTVSSLGLL